MPSPEPGSGHEAAGISRCSWRAAAAWPLAARAQQPERMRRIGTLSAFGADDPEWQVRIAAFRHRLRQLGWIEGRNLRMDYRYSAGDPERGQT